MQNNSESDSSEDEDAAAASKAAAATAAAKKKKKQRAKKAPKATSKVTPKASGRKSKTPKASTGRRTKAQAESFVASADESDLFNALLSGAPAEEIGTWIARYDQDQHGASAELLTFVVRCCGSKETVRRKMLDNVQNACTDISDKFGSDDTNADGYPLMEKAGKVKDKGFGKKLDKFVVALVEACEAEVLHDDFLMKTVSSWTTAFSTSPVRAFRHTCTHLALKLGECYIKVHSACENEQKAAERQLETESKKSKGKKARSKKAEALEQRLNEVQESMENLWELVEGIYSGVSTHRYRDVSYVIRQLACESLGAYVCLAPSKMMDDKYLKYIGWLLNDKDASVRRTAVDALQKILSLPDAAETLDLFINRFRGRVVNMAEDQHPGVVASALELMVTFAAMDKLEAEEIENMQELIFSEDAQVRKAAGKLLHATLVETDIPAIVAEEALDNHEVADGATASPALILKYLANVGINRAPLYTGIRAKHIVDALWPHTDAIKDWSAYHELFEQATVEYDSEQAGTGTAMTTSDEAMLFKIFAAAAQRACGTLEMVGSRRITPSRATEDARADISRFFVAKMPELFAKFGSDTANATCLMQVAQLLELKEYTESRVIKQLDLLLKHVTDGVLKSSDLELIDASMTVLANFAAQVDSPLHAQAVSARETLGENLITRLTKAVTKGVPEEAGVDEDEDEDDEGAGGTGANGKGDGKGREASLGAMAPDAYQLAVTLDRLNALVKTCPLTDHEIIEPVQQVLNAGVDNDINDWILIPAMQLMVPTFAWHMMHNAAEGDADSILSLTSARDDFIAQLDKLLTAGKAAVQEQAYYSIIDTATLFDVVIVDAENEALHPLALFLDDGVQENLLAYVEETHLDDDDEEDEEEEARKMASAKKRDRKRDGDFSSSPSKSKSSRHDDDDDNDDDDLDAEEDVHPALTPLEVAKVLKDEDKHSVQKNALAAFCRMVAYGAINASFLANLLPYYLVSDTHTDLIKATIGKLRERDYKDTCKAVMRGLQEMFENEMEAGEEADLVPIKDIAHRIALTFGLAVKTDDVRRAIILIHRDGIDFALKGTPLGKNGPSANIDFLEIVKEFTIKLTKQDKTGNKGIAAYLDEQIRGYGFKPRRTADEWSAHKLFLDNLEKTQKAGGAGGATPATNGRSAKGGSKGSKRKSSLSASFADTRKRLTLDDEVEDDIEEDDEVAAEEDDDEAGENFSQQSWIGGKSKRSGGGRANRSYATLNVKGGQGSSRGGGAAAAAASDLDSESDAASAMGDSDDDGFDVASPADISRINNVSIDMSPMSRVKMMRASRKSPRKKTPLFDKDMFAEEPAAKDDSDSESSDDDDLKKVL